MRVIEKSTWLLLDEHDKLKVVTNLLDTLQTEEKLHALRHAKSQLLKIINWLDDTDD